MMMDTSDEGVSIGDLQTGQVMYSNELTDAELMQFVQCVGNSQFMMPAEGQHLSDRRPVLNPPLEPPVHQQPTVNSPAHVSVAMNHPQMPQPTHGQMQPMCRPNPVINAIESCNYRTSYDQYSNSSGRQPHFDYRSSELSSSSLTPISETVTHVSETDRASMGTPHGYNPHMANVGSQNYNLPASNAWDHSAGSYSLAPNQQVRPVKELPGPSVHSKPAPSRHIPRQRVSNLPQTVGSQQSITSTPVNKTFQTFNGAMNLNQNVHHQGSRSDGQLVDKRLVITFKVVEQIVDHSNKILKEVVVRNEEVIRNFGKVAWPETPSTISNISTSVQPSHSSSGMLADISSSGKESVSRHLNLENPHDVSSDHLKSPASSSSSKDSLLIKSPSSTPVKHAKSTQKAPQSTEETRQQDLAKQASPEMVKRTTSTKTASSSDPLATSPIRERSKKELSKETIEITKEQTNDEDERRDTANALLSLQSRMDLKVEVDSSEECPHTIKPGSKVMGKWRDKNYYPAVIKQQIQNNKWSLVFEDGASRQLFESEIINIGKLPVGQSVMVNISDGFCTKGTICSVESNGVDFFYSVELVIQDKQEVNRYERKDIFLTNEQALALFSKIGKPQLTGAVFADVDLDNIVVGKRQTRKVKAEKPAKTGRKGRRPNVETGADNSNREPVRKKRKMGNVQGHKKKCVVNVPNEVHRVITPLSISPRAIKSNSISMPPQELVKLLGPLPDNESCLFTGISFLLTSGDRINDTDEGGRSTPFDRAYLTRQIETGGGRVFESFEEIKNSEEANEIVLIADTYHRSIKYMQCLAAGIPVVSHMWVIDCCKQKSLIKRDNYFLPSGFSVITNGLPSDKLIFRKSANLFKGMKFYFGSDQIKELWSPVLLAAQAQVVEELNCVPGPSRKTTAVDMIIADPTCPEEVVKKARQMKIPMVSGEYIVQCLINGRKLAVEANPKFVFDFK